MGGTADSAELVHTDLADGVATITLDSQHNRNALSRSLVEQVMAALDRCDADDDVQVVVIAAAGRAFCAGADMAEAATDGMQQASRTLVALQRRILTLRRPVVVRLHAAVRAGGLGIVGAADIVLAARSVTFAFTEARLALAPAMISLTTLPRMSSRDAARTFLTGAAFDADEAQRMGLVSRAVPDEQLDAAVAETVRDLRSAAPQGLRATKELLNEPIVRDIDARGEELAQLSADLFASPDARAAMDRFLQRRGR